MLVPLGVKGRLAGVGAVALARPLNADLGEGVRQPEKILLDEILGAEDCSGREGEDVRSGGRKAGQSRRTYW